MFECITLDDDLPVVGCVYFLFNDDELVYIGQTKSLKQRMMYLNVYLNPNIYLGKKKISEDVFNKIYYRVEEDKPKRVALEKQYYDAYDPKLNFNGVFSPYMYLNHARHMEFRLKMGLEQRYEV